MGCARLRSCESRPSGLFLAVLRHNGFDLIGRPTIQRAVRDRLIELFHVERYESTYGSRGIQRVQVQPLMAEVVPRFGAIGQSGSIAVLERFFHALKEEMLRRLLIVPRRFAAMQRELTSYMFWYNQHRPSSALEGRTPAEVRDGGLAASERPRWETRVRYPLARGRTARLVRRVKGRLELVVDRVDGRDHLPVVSLREAA